MTIYKKQIEYYDGMCITISIQDVGIYASEVKAKMKTLYPNGYSVEKMMAMTGLMKLEQEGPKWLKIQRSDSMTNIFIKDSNEEDLT